MKYLMLVLMLTMFGGCMTVPVEVFKCGTGDLTINIVLDKTVDTMPIQADGNTVPISAMP